MTRLVGAILAVRQAIATAADIPIDSVPADDDLIDDLCLDELERESLGLIIEELFGVKLHARLWSSPLYRTAAALAEWIIRKSEEAAWAERHARRATA